jgi:hypothetical protein
MRFRTTFLVLALIALAATPAMAFKDTAKTAPYAMNNGSDTREVFEGFEGAFPPAGWTAVANGGHTGLLAWYQGTNSFEGLYAASVDYDPALVPQDNVLSFMHTVAAGENHLNFQISGSAYWSTNYDVTVEVDGMVMYSWAANVVDNWVFQLVDIDLSDYMGQTVEIAFRYAGVDGAAIYLDAVGLNEGYEPPPPPEAPLNDTCQGALDNGFELFSGAFSFSTDNTEANADYPLGTGSCTGYSASGNDVVYYVCLDQGQQLDVSMQCGFDASLYIITDCADPMGTCVAGADNTISEGLEEIIGFTAPADGVYFVVVSAYSSGVGPIEVYGTNYGDGCEVATESTTFDGLKSLYR